MDFERELSALDVAWPETPAFRLELPQRRRRRLLVAVLVAAAVAVGAAFAVPSSRAAILRFLHLRGVTIERVERLPAAQERPLGAGLGAVVTPAEAAQALGRRSLLPALDPEPPLHLAGGVVSLVYRAGERTILLSEIPSEGGGIFKKLAGLATHVEPVLGGIWLTGAPHVVLFPGAPSRIAGNVLLVERGGLLLRIEGRGLSKGEALRLAAGIR